MVTPWAHPCSSRLPSRHRRRGGAGTFWTPPTLTSDWRRATSCSWVRLDQVRWESSHHHVTMTIDHERNCCCCLLFLYVKNEVNISYFRQNLAGPDPGEVSWCSLCDMWLHHSDSSRICRGGHWVSHCQTVAGCKLLSGESAARWVTQDDTAVITAKLSMVTHGWRFVQQTLQAHV